MDMDIVKYSIGSCDLILLFVFLVTGAEFTDIPLSNVRKASGTSILFVIIK